MKQILNKLVKQKMKIKKDIGKIYYNIEINEEEKNEIKKEIEIIRRAIRDKNEIFDDLSLRITELKNSITHYENDIIVLRDRITNFEGLRNNKLKRKSIKQNNKNMKQ